MPSGTSYGFGVDYYAMYELGNAWIRLGDELDERTRTMSQAVAGMDWSGSAAGSMRTVWGEGSGDATSIAGVTSLLMGARDNAYQIGGAIHHYAAKVLEAEERAEKLALASFLGGLFGSLLTLAFPLIASVGFFGRAFIILDQAVGRLAGVITRMIPNALLGPGARAVAERGLGYIGAAITGAATNTAVDFAIQAISHRAVGETWKPTAIDAAFSAGFGGVFGAVGYVGFRGNHLPGPNTSVPRVTVPAPSSGSPGLPQRSASGGFVPTVRDDGLHQAPAVRPTELNLRQVPVPSGRTATPPHGSGSATPAPSPDAGGAGGRRHDAGGQDENLTLVAPAAIRVEGGGAEWAVPLGGARETPSEGSGGEGAVPFGGTRETPPADGGVIGGAAPRPVPEPHAGGHDPAVHAGTTEALTFRRDEWQTFLDDRDAVYLNRLDLEERYNWATAFGPDKDVVATQARFRERDPEGTALIERDPATLRDLNASYHRDLRQGFEASWHRTGGRPDADPGWAAELSRLRGGLGDRFEHFAHRQRLLDEFDDAFTRSLDQFRSDDLFGGAYLADPPESAHAVRYDEATGMPVAFRDPGPAAHVRATGRAEVTAATDLAWQSAGNRRPAGEHARTLDESISDLHSGLPARLAHRSDQERQVEHAGRDFDRAHADWQDDVRVGGQISEEAADRARHEFLRDLRRHHDDLGRQLEGAPPERFGRAWERTNEGLVGTVPERLEHSGFRARALERGQRALDDALARHQERSPLEATVSEDSRERLAMAWNRDIETTVDDHWFRAREAAARQPGSAAPEGPDLTPDGQLSWDERFEDLASTLPHRITHELEKDIVLGQAARDFHHLAGHPDDLRGQRYDVSVKQFDDIAKDFRTDTLTQYDRIWAPAEADSRAWLAHEASRADLFATTLARAQESPLQAPPRPAPRPDADAPVTGTRSEATPLRIDPDLGRQPDSAESSSGRSTSLGDQQTHETAHSARTDDRAASGSPFRMDEAQIQVVREEPVSQTLSSSGPRQGFGEPRTTAAEAHGPLGALRDQPPVRPAGQGDYGEEFGSTLRTDPAYAHGAAAQELYTARLDVLRQQYVDARTAMDVNGPADAAQVEELRRGVTDAAGRLRAESAMIADTVREFHDRYAELGRELSHDLGARIWYTRQISSVEDEFRAALTNQGVVALAGLERHFSAQAQAVRAAAHTDLAGPDARSQDWRSAVWQTRREQLDATYREALAHAAQEYPATVAEATSTLPTTDGSAADVLHDPDSSSAAVHAEHLAQVRARFHEALDHAQDSVTAGIVSRTAHQETADEHLTPEAALLAAFEIEDPALTETAAAVLRAEFDGALRATAAAQPAPAESVPEQASPDWDGWLARQVEDLPVRLALEAARAAAVAEARDLGETMGRAWESALPVPSPIFVKVFDIMPGPVPAVLREAVVDAYVADVTTRFDDAFAGLTAAGSARGLLGTRLQEWHLFSRQATERLDMWFPVALAGRRAVSVAERHFDQHLAGLEPAAPLSTHQAQRLRHEFAVRAQEAFTQIFAGHTGEASDLTARTWRWEAVLSGLTRDVPDQVAFEATAATSLHEAGQSFQRLSRGHDLDTDRLEELAVGYRRDWFHELRTVWAPPGLPETWLDHEEQTDDAFTGGLTDLWTTEAEPEWQKSSQSIPREDGGPVYCVEAAPVCFAPYRTERQEPPR